MEFVYNVTYMKCQSCAAKVSCSTCSEEVTTSLRRIPEIEDVSVDFNQKRIKVICDDEDAALDALDDLGIFTD